MVEYPYTRELLTGSGSRDSVRMGPPGRPQLTTFGLPVGCAYDSAGSIYFEEYDQGLLIKIDAQGVSSVVLGNANHELDASHQAYIFELKGHLWFGKKYACTKIR